MVGRRASAGSGRLQVWANGESVGLWQVTGGEHRFHYDDAWLRSPLGRPLSLSMSFAPGNPPHRGDVVRNFFDNLLPDSDTIRRRLQQKFATAGTGPFDLLAAIGRDCVGSVQLLPPDTPPTGWNRIDAQALDEAGVEQVIDQALAAARPLGQAMDGDLRISIAGAQEKTALLLHEGHWCKPAGATPSTHIFKLPLGLVGNMRADMSSSVENEWLCARLLRAFGLPVATCGMTRFGRHKVLVVERFDRRVVNEPSAQAWIARLPQEDFCQALGLPGSLKYESDGGPGIRSLLRTLQASSQSAQDSLNFVKAQLVFWLLAATDGHAKNFSIFLERGGSYRLTPLYDVLSAWPIIGSGPNQIPFRRAKLAMALRSRNAHFHLHEVHTRHWRSLAHEAGVPFEALVALVSLAPRALEQVASELPAGYPAQVWDTIRTGVQTQMRRFEGGLAEA
jgi:serine/threonine-protein kinase HipA